MKKILIYTFSLLLAGVTASCIDDKLNRNGAYNDSTGELTLDFNLEIPTPQSIKTRGELLDMAANEEEENYYEGLLPYIFIFEDTGSPESNYLRTIVHGSRITLARNENPNHENNRNCTKMTAVVSGTAEDALLHIVLIQAREKDEFEQQLAEISDRSEIGMFSGATGLYSCGATYWKRIQLGMPLNKENLTAIQDKLQCLKMVRNFVQILVGRDESVTNFTLTGFVVLNGMDRAYVAPYNESTGEGYENFVDFEKIPDQQADDSGMAFYNYLTRTVKYIPARHPLASREYKDNDLTDWLPDVEWNTNAKYTFERPLEDTRMTCVLIKGVYTDNNGPKECYYKLDIGDYDRTKYEEGSDYNGYGVFQLYNLIRNVIYDITITDVGAAGHDSVESAIVSPPANNISASVKTRNVLSITDFVDTFEVKMYTYNRDGVTLSDKYVDGTTLVIIDDEDNPGNPYPLKVRLQWRYEDGENGPKRFLDNDLNNDLMCKHTGFELAVGDIIKSINGQTDDSWSWTSYGDNWYGCDIEFDAPTDIPQQKTIKLYKPFGLSRDITLILRKRWEFIDDKIDDPNKNIEVYPGEYGFIPENTMPAETLGDVKKLIPGPDDVGSMRNAQLTVMFELPADIPQSLFPLEFKLGFDRQNTDNAYVGNAVVVYGDSMFEDQNDPNDPGRLVPRMQFVKTIDWDYYNGTGDRGDHGHKIVCVRFVTTTDVIAELGDLVEGNDYTNQQSTTRVRVYNQYFTLGEGSFTRTANNDGDPDPYQTEWFWFFGDYGWQNNSGNYTSTADGVYTGLHFNTHDWGTQWGRYMGFAHNGINGVANINENNYSFYFEPGATAPADGNGYTATLTITGASLYYSRSTGWFGSANNRRRAIVRIDVKQTDGTTRQILFNRDEDNDNNNASKHVPFFFQSQDGNGLGMPRACEETFEIAPGETIEKVTIWSARYYNDDTDATYTKTLYYSIRLSLAAK